MKLQHVYGLVNGTVHKPDGTNPTALAEWGDKDLVAQVLIKNNLSDEQMIHIDQDTITTVVAMWQSLWAVYETHGYSALTAAKHTFYSMCAAEDANIPEHITEVGQQYNKINQMGCKITDGKLQSVIITSLSSLWDYLVASWQASHVKAKAEGKPSITL